MKLCKCKLFTGLFTNIKAYSFGHLKSAKSSENGRLTEKNVSYQKNANSENGGLGRLRAKTIRILKTVGLANFA